MKNSSIIFKIACILCAVLMLFCACGKKATAYIYSTDGNVLEENQVTLSGITYMNLMEQLAEKNVVPEDTQVKDFQNTPQGDARAIKLDLTDGFKAYIEGCDGNMQRLTLQCIANTYIKNYGVDSVTVLCGGEPIATDEYDFSGALTFVSPNTVVTATPAASVVTATAYEEALSTATAVINEADAATPTATAKPTATATAYPTPTPRPRDNSKKVVALSFDDGPHTKYTRMIVDKLKEYNATATFFIVGNHVDDTTGAAIKYATDNGCEIQIHGYTHEVYYNTCSEERYQEELSKTAAVIEKYCGVTPTLMRPFGGSITKERVAACQYAVILWDVDSEDWKHKKSSEVDITVENVMNNVKDGSIILMHEIYQTSYDAFCIIMERLQAEGYEVVTVSELLAGDLQCGKKYFSR